jgi:hypothetical protein
MRSDAATDDEAWALDAKVHGRASLLRLRVFEGSTADGSLAKRMMT